MLPPAYNERGTKKIFILNRKYLSEDFYESENLSLPVAMAYPCAVYLKRKRSVFVHSRNKSLMLDLKTLQWKALDGADNCVNDGVIKYPDHRTQCELFGDEMIIIPGYRTNNSAPCTSVFNATAERWMPDIADDGRHAVFGGGLIGTPTGRLLYLGGRTEWGRKAAKNDGMRRLTDQESVRTGLTYSYEFAGLDEPSMRRISEFDGRKWTRWSLQLPVPVNNVTIVNVDNGDDKFCDGAKKINAEEFDKKRALKDDVSISMREFSRCGWNSIETAYPLNKPPTKWQRTYLNTLLPNSPLKGLMCFNRIVFANHIRTFPEAARECRELGSNVRLPRNAAENEDFHMGKMYMRSARLFHRKYPYRMIWIGAEFDESRNK